MVCDVVPQPAQTRSGVSMSSLRRKPKRGQASGRGRFKACVRPGWQNRLMPYHVTIWPQSPRQQTLRELYAFNLTEEQLRERFIGPHDEGRPSTGGTHPAGWRSQLPACGPHGNEFDEQTAKIQFKEYELFKSTLDVTTHGYASTRVSQLRPPRVHHRCLIPLTGSSRFADASMSCDGNCYAGTATGPRLRSAMNMTSRT